MQLIRIVLIIFLAEVFSYYLALVLISKGFFMQKICLLNKCVVNLTIINN